MKSPEAALREVILENQTMAEAINTRLYPVIAPATVTTPFVVYRRSAIRREATFTGPLGNPTVSIEFQLMADTYESVRTLADSLRKAIDGWTGVVGDVLIRQTFLDQEYDHFAQLQGAEMPAVYCVSQSYDVIWEEIQHGNN
jgi:hypothetical protein